MVSTSGGSMRYGSSPVRCNSAAHAPVQVHSHLPVQPAGACDDVHWLLASQQVGASVDASVTNANSVVTAVHWAAAGGVHEGAAVVDVFVVHGHSLHPVQFAPQASVEAVVETTVAVAA